MFKGVVRSLNEYKYIYRLSKTADPTNHYLNKLTEIEAFLFLYSLFQSFVIQPKTRQSSGAPHDVNH